MKPIEEMTIQEQITWACGEVLIGIGEGRFRDAMAGVVLAITRDAYHRGSGDSKKAFDAGMKEGLKLGRKVKKKADKMVPSPRDLKMRVH